MVAEVSQHINEIVALCKKMQVTSLYLFGSALNAENFKKTSDIDLLLEYRRDHEGLPLAPFDYFDLLFALEQLLDRKVDLVVEGGIKNPFFRQHVNNEKFKLYSE